MGNAGEGAVNAHERRGWEHIDNEDAYYNRFPTHPPPKSGKRKWLVSFFFWPFFPSYDTNALGV
jgi:hypothetical protein